MKRSIILLSIAGACLFPFANVEAVNTSTNEHYKNNRYIKNIVSNYTIEFEGWSVKDKEKIAQIIDLLPDKKEKKQSFKLSKKNLLCLAKNIFHEAHTEDMQGKIAVGYATLERLKYPQSYGRTICQVIKKKGEMSWQKSYKKRKMIVPKEYRKIALNIVNGIYQKPFCNATHWYNFKLDSKSSFNARQFLKGKSSCTYKPYENSNHTFIAYYKH